MILGDEKLIQKCIKDGAKEFRDDKKLMFATTYEHDDGVIIIYQNNATN